VNTIHIEHRFGAPPAKVFDAITDHAAMGRWLAGTRVTIDRPGNPSPNGVGAVRKISARGLTLYEEIVRYEPPRAMDYRVIRGAPLRNHLGTIRLEPDGSGTRLVYDIRFEIPWYLGGALLGAVLVRTLEGEIRKGLPKLDALAAAA
jgi:uncharacterized protein YndB with AHSA1/START domain